MIKTTPPMVSKLMASLEYWGDNADIFFFDTPEVVEQIGNVTPIEVVKEGKKDKKCVNHVKTQNNTMTMVMVIFKYFKINI